MEPMRDPELMRVVDFHCRTCGAALVAPSDISILQVTCQFCGAMQPLPDSQWRVTELRQRAAEEARQQQRRQIDDTVKHARRMSSVGGWIGGVIALVSVAAGMWPVLKMSGCLPSLWNGKEPFECGGNDRAHVSGVTAHMKGTAIYATGNCELTVEDCDIQSDVAIKAEGNARVTLKGGTIDGKIVTTGNGSVENLSAKVKGKAKAYFAPSE